MAHELNVRVVSRRMVKASDSSIKPHVLTLSNLDLVMQNVQLSALTIYPKPPTANFKDVVAVFENGLPSLLNHFFPFAGRIATNGTSGLPEVHCNNQGAELVVGEAGVPLASLDYCTMATALRTIHLPPCSDDLALSVQVVSFTCGGFTVTWRTHHMLVDGSALVFLTTALCELARSGPGSTLSARLRPNLDRSIFRPQRAGAIPASSSYPGDGGPPLMLFDEEKQRQVEALVAADDTPFVDRLYYVHESVLTRLREAASRDGHRATRVEALSAYLWKALAGAMAAGDDDKSKSGCCRMALRVNGRWQVTDPDLRAALHNYVGNATALSVRDARTQELVRMPLPDVAALVREAITEPSYDEHFQELVDWVEDHKTKRFVETALLGLGGPTLKIAAVSSFKIDTDFGFGPAAMVMPTTTYTTMRLYVGCVTMISRPGDDGSWIVHATVWPRLAQALESSIFKPLMAEYLGLSAPHVAAGLPKL